MKKNFYWWENNEKKTKNMNSQRIINSHRTLRRKRLKKSLYSCSLLNEFKLATISICKLKR